jgi:hypothetical protein
MRKLTKTRNVIENLLWSWDALFVWSECFRLAAFFLILSQNNQVYLQQLRNKQNNKRIHCSTASFVCFGRLWNWFIYIHISIKYIIYVGNGVSQILHKSTLEPDNVDKF